jgi:hypothetical protein
MIIQFYKGKLSLKKIILIITKYGLDPIPDLDPETDSEPQQKLFVLELHFW